MVLFIFQWYPKCSLINLKNPDNSWPLGTPATWRTRLVDTPLAHPPARRLPSHPPAHESTKTNFERISFFRCISLFPAPLGSQPGTLFFNISLERFSPLSTRLPGRYSKGVSLATVFHLPQPPTPHSPSLTPLSFSLIQNLYCRVLIPAQIFTLNAFGVHCSPFLMKIFCFSYLIVSDEALSLGPQWNGLIGKVGRNLETLKARNSINTKRGGLNSGPISFLGKFTSKSTPQALKFTR